MTLKALLTLLLALPVHPEDREASQKPDQLAQIATGVTIASVNRPRPPADWAALLITIARFESSLRIRIHEGQCKSWECDRGRARGLWQLHKNLHTESYWDQLTGVEHTATQARVASDMLTRAYWSCARSGVPWLQGTINAYAGRRCSAEWRGLDERMKAFENIRRKL